MNFKEIFFSYFPLGFISFGGPNAHIALLHDIFVKKKRWLNDSMFMVFFFKNIFHRFNN